MKSLRQMTRVCLVLGLLGFGMTSQASMCMDIYTKVHVHGCLILKKLPYAKDVCDVVNHGANEVCEWCSIHPNVCLAIAGAILFKPDEKHTLYSPISHRQML